LSAAASKAGNRGEKPDEFFLLTSLISRRLAYPFAVLFCRLGVSANAVTVLGGSLWVLSAILMVMSGWLLAGGECPLGQILLVLSMVLVNLGYILDVADGSIARMTNASSLRGQFLDYVFHLIFHPMYFCSVGVFLYLITGVVGYLVLGVLSICAGWGASFSAREHVLCECIANRKLDPSRLTEEQRHHIFIDSDTTKQPVERKRGIRFCVAFAKELFLFPGQYTFFSLLMILDLALAHGASPRFMLLKSAFLGIATLSVIRVPFRIRREFRTLRTLDGLQGESP
jgi:phosphatidylglycerophosphate synthase